MFIYTNIFHPKSLLLSTNLAEFQAIVLRMLVRWVATKYWCLLHCRSGRNIYLCVILHRITARNKYVCCSTPSICTRILYFYKILIILNKQSLKCELMAQASYFDKINMRIRDEKLLVKVGSLHPNSYKS